MSNSNNKKLIFDGLWRNNPVFCQILGICSTLAVTNLVLNTTVMCVALIFTLSLSAVSVALLRSFTPKIIRMMVETLIIAFYVIIIDIILKAYWPEMSRNLGPYVGLIITNCIVMGRCEACAASNPPGIAFLDAFWNAAGYAFVLILIATIREILGMGTFAGLPVPYFSGPNWDKWIIMVMPPGAFFVLALLVWAIRSIQMSRLQNSA